MIEGLPHVVVWAAVASDKVYVCVTPQPRSDGRLMPDQYFKVRPNPGSWGRVFGAFADTMGVPRRGARTGGCWQSWAVVAIGSFYLVSVFEVE